MIKHRLDSIVIEVSFKDENETLFDPDSQTHEIYDPDGTLKSTLTETQEATGVFRVEYSLPADAAYGDWYLKTSASAGSYDEAEYFYFTVQKKPED